MADCVEALHAAEVAKESDTNTKIFFGEEGKLWTEEGTYVAEERENKNVKVNKFLKGLYGDDAEDMARAAPPKAGAKASLTITKTSNHVQCS